MKPFYKTLFIGSAFLASGFAGLTTAYSHATSAPAQVSPADIANTNDTLNQQLAQLKHANNQLRIAIATAEKQDNQLQTTLNRLQQQALALQHEEQLQKAKEEEALRTYVSQQANKPVVQAVTRASGAKHESDDEREHEDDD